MRRNIFTYVGPVRGLKPALDEFTKKQQLLKSLKYFILTNTDIKKVTVDEYIISVLNGRC